MPGPLHTYQTPTFSTPVLQFSKQNFGLDGTDSIETEASQYIEPSRTSIIWDHQTLRNARGHLLHCHTANTHQTYRENQNAVPTVHELTRSAFSFINAAMFELDCVLTTTHTVSRERWLLVKLRKLQLLRALGFHSRRWSVLYFFVCRHSKRSIMFGLSVYTNKLTKLCKWENAALVSLIFRAIPGSRKLLYCCNVKFMAFHNQYSFIFWEKLWTQSRQLSSDFKRQWNKKCSQVPSHFHIPFSLSH